MKIKLTESKLKQIVNESIQNVLKEYYETQYNNFESDDDVKHYTTFKPQDRGYISDITFEEFLKDKYHEMYENVEKQIDEICEAGNKKDYKYFRMNDFYLLAEEYYETYKEVIKTGIDDQIRYVIDSYLEIVTNSYDSSFEMGNNDYEYPNRNYDYFSDDNEEYNLAKKILFDKNMMGWIGQYFELRNAIIESFK